jgi:CDP-4-dehydro-6-deoxyglucose reductase/ferredoxin-NAD(P)+ reductase (naphthalene dioxygenase ferredoxin-specific)
MSVSAALFQVRIGNLGATIACAPDQTILAASVAAGLDYPYGCATGNCGACISKLESGEVVLLPRNDAALSCAQAAAGQTLACRAQPRSDLVITWLGRGRK